MKAKLLPTLTQNLTRWYSLSFSAVLAIAFLAIYLTINWMLQQRLDEDLHEDVREFQALYQSHGMNRVLLELEREGETGDAETFFILLLNAAGDPIANTDLEGWPDLLTTETLSEPSNRESKLQWLNRTFFSGTRFIKAPLGDNKTTLIIGESGEEKAEILSLLLLVIVVTLLLAMPIIAFIGRYTTQHAVRGIAIVSEAASNFKHADFRQTVEVQAGCQEVADLTAAFNTMLARIETLIREIHELTDNVAHDMRSPLGRIRAIAETSLLNNNSTDYQVAGGQIIEESDRLNQMISTALDISELESGANRFDMMETDIRALTEEVFDFFSAVAEEKKIAFSASYQGECERLANPSALQRMLANLLDNAIKYTPSEGYVTLDFKANQTSLDIKLCDSGIGIAEAEQARIFERFYRCDRSRTKHGCGLGLSFARAVARAHGGDISVSSKAHQGSCFVVSLPQQPN